MGQTSKIEIPWVDWQELDTKVLLNPRWSTAELLRLQELALAFPQKNHLWVASSGSSSSSENSVKLIALSREAFLVSAKAVNEHLQSTSQDVWAQVLPQFHVGGLGIFARAFISGAKVIDALDEGQWKASHFLKICEQEKISLSALVPTQVFDLISLGLRAPNSLRAVIIGGAALSDDLYHQALDLGWPLLPSYGMTETCSQVATSSLRGIGHRDRRLKMLFHTQARVDADGFFQFHGSSLLTGFAQWRNGEKFFEDPKHEGWLKTQDLGEIETDGGRGGHFEHQQILKPKGRDSDFVKISGEGVHLLKLNEVLSTVLQKIVPRAVQNVVVLAVPDERTENRIELVVGTNELSAADILHLCQQFNALVAPYEKIRKEHFVSEIPRSSLGKVLWTRLLEKLNP